jgi:hypothetical protein
MDSFEEKQMYNFNYNRNIRTFAIAGKATQSSDIRTLKKVNFSLEQSMKAQRRSKINLYFFLKLGVR